MYKLLLLLLPILLFSKFQVTTTLPFEAYIIKKIGQNHVRIKTISNSYSNKLLELSPTEISSLSNTKAYFNFSLEIEKKYEELFLKTNENLNIVHMSENIKKIKYMGKDNPYVWLDPILLRDVAKNIFEALVKIDSFNKSSYERNYNKFLLALDKSFLDTKRKLDSSEIYNIFVFDERFDYFAKRFKINIYRQKKRILNASEIKTLVEEVELNEIKAVFTQERENIIYAKSLSGNSNISVKTYNIYETILFFNLSKITQEFVSK
jgi:zinc transport system substrate-binding protein